MGAIPTFTTPAAMVPSVGGPPMADAAAFAAPAAAAARAGQETANAGFAFAEKYINAKLEVDAADQSADVSKQLTQAQFDASKIPDRAAATEHYDAATLKIRESYDQSGANPLVKAHVTARLQTEAAQRRAATQHASWALESETARGKLIAQGDEATRQAVAATDDRLRETIIENHIAAIQGRVSAGMANPETAAKEIATFKSGVYANLIQTAMTSDPAAGVAAFKKYEGQLTAHDANHLRIATASAEKGIAIDNAAYSALPPLPGSAGTVMGQLTAQFPDIAKRVTSTNRDHDHNAKAGGAPNSMHLEPGKAIDISLAGMPEEQKQAVIGAILANPNVGGFGYYPQSDSIHFDTRSGPRTAWGADHTSGSTAAFPPWMKDKVQAWQAGKAAGGDSAADWNTEALRRRAAKAADSSIPFAQRAAEVTRMDSVISTHMAYVTAQRKQIVDDFDLKVTNLAIRGSDVPPGTFSILADRMEATGDRSMAAMYRDVAENEAALKNFWNLPPALQAKYAHSVPGEAGRNLRAALVEGGKARTEAMREANEQAQIVHRLISDKDNPEIAKTQAEEAARKYIEAGRPDLAKRIQQDYVGAVTGYKLGNATPMQIEARRNSINNIVKEGGADLNANLALQESFKKTSTAAQELWKNDAVTAWFNMVEKTPPILDEKTQNDPQLLKAWVDTMSDAARQAQTAKFYGAPAVPTAQIVGPMSQNQASIWKQSLESSSVEQQRATVAKWAEAIPPDMVGAFVKQIGGDKKDGAGDFGHSIGVAMWHYKRNEPDDRVMADDIIKGANIRMKGGPEAKNMVSPSDLTVRATFDVALGGSRNAFLNEPGLIDMLDDAAVSLYTSRRFGKTDMSTYDEGAMKKAIAAVYGTRFNGMHGDVLMPRGMDTGDFRNAVANIRDSDVPAYTDRLGRPLTAAMVKTEGKFVTVGDGVYKVQFPGAGNGAMYDIPLPSGLPWTVKIREMSARGPAPGFSARGAPPRVINNPNEIVGP